MQAGICVDAQVVHARCYICVIVVDVVARGVAISVIAVVSA